MKKRLAQNKIDYIVYNNVENAASLLDSFNYRPVKNPKHLARAIRELVKVEGRPAIEALVKIHPDRAAILKTANRELEKQESKCGICEQAISTNEQVCSTCAVSFQPEFDGFTTKQSVSEKDSNQLKADLEVMMKAYRQKPEDQQLAVAIQQTWNELRGRKDQDSAKEQSNFLAGSKQFLVTWIDALMFLGFALFAGYMMYHKPAIK